MAKLLKPGSGSSRFESRFSSAPYTTPTNNEETKIEHSAAFPRTFQHNGYLDVRTREDKPWKRRYFVVNNNFLLSAATPHSPKLEQVLPLEGAKTRSTQKSSDMNFELFVQKHRLYFRAASPKQCTTWANAMNAASKLKIKDIYRFLYTLGTSGLTKVVAAKHRTSGEDSAIKIIDKRECDRKMLKTEIQILKKLNSPQIVQLYDLIETKKYLYIVMEKCSGGELFDQIAECDHFNEEDCCLILHQIAKGVKYMHSCGIVHRDLKPENILCCQPGSVKKVKIADFGISKIMKNVTSSADLKKKQMQTTVGTLSYTAPEILQKRGYDYTVDFWSIGVIMFILLCGYPPFYGDDDVAVTDSIMNDSLELEEADWEHVSLEAKNLVRALLSKDPALRASCDDILKLAWKVSSKSLSFAKMKRKFRQTVIKSKFHRHSLSVFEKDSALSRKLNRRYGGVSNTQNMKEPSPASKDDLATGDDMKEHEDKQQKIKNAFRGPRRSRGTEELLELRLPLHQRDSLFAITEENDNVDGK